MIKRIWAQFTRDRLTLSLAFLLPLMFLLIYSSAIRLEIKNIPLLVQDLALGQIQLLVDGVDVNNARIIANTRRGTLEQLLMTPAAEWEILVAKTVPLVIVLLADVGFILLSHLIFDLPLGQHLFLCFEVSGIYILGIIEVGLLIGTIFQNQQQTQLIAFSLNVPLVLLCGAITSIESMPILFQYLASLNPLRHYVSFLRSVLLKDVGFDALFPQITVIGLFAAILFPLSIHQFRS